MKKEVEEQDISLSRDRLKKNIMRLMDVLSDEIESYLNNKTPILMEKDKTFERIKGLILDLPKLDAAAASQGEKSEKVEARRRNGTKIKGAADAVFI